MTTPYSDRVLAGLFTVLADLAGASTDLGPALRARCAALPPAINLPGYQIARRLEDGATLAEALAADPGIPAAFSEIVAGVEDPASSLARLAGVANQRAARHRQLCRILVVPCIFAGAAMLVILLSAALGWISELGLPPETRPLTSGRIFWLGMVVGLLVLQGVWIALTVAVWRRAQLAYDLPFVGPAMRIGETATFYQTVGALVAGGMPVEQSLAVTADGLAWDSLAVEARHAAQGLAVGAAIDEVLGEMRCLRSVTGWMVGPEPGAEELAQVLSSLGQDLHRESLLGARRVGFHMELALLVLVLVTWGSMIMASNPHLTHLIDLLEQLG